MSASETIQFQVTPELRKRLEEGAARLHLTVSAYIMYLDARLAPGRDAERLDRHVEQVFGRHGELMRRLAQ